MGLARTGELPADVGAVSIVDGQITSVYKDPAIAEYLKLHEQDVHWRATIMKMGEAGLFGEVETEEVREGVRAPDYAVETFRRVLHG